LMRSTQPIVHFVHHFLCFFWTQALQQHPSNDL
jgi:hypothetical protein